MRRVLPVELGAPRLSAACAIVRASASQLAGAANATSTEPVVALAFAERTPDCARSAWTIGRARRGRPRKAAH
jgi:hypothetical protein